MSNIDLRECPNCGVHAIVVEPNTQPNEAVDCNNCHSIFLLKDLVL